jgi:sec-independent protein translocase protein TatA
VGSLRPWHIILIVVVLVLLFGAKRLPDAARSLGRSLRIIKAETQGLINENSDVAEKAEPQYGREPLNGEVQQAYPQQQYQQQAPPAPQYQQQPAPQYQQQPQQPQQQPSAQPYQQPPAQPFADPTAVPRTNDR